MRARSIDLLVAGLVAVTATGLAISPEVLPWLRPILTVPLVLVLPGYAIVAALMPRLPARAELAALSVATSLGFAAMSGVLLSLFGIPLTTRPWALLLGGVTLFAVVVAALRRDPVVAPASSRRRQVMTPLQVAFMGYAVIVAGVAVSAGPSARAELPDSGTTQLWMLASDPEVNGAIRVGVANFEPATATYRLELRHDGSVADVWPSIRLEPGQTWERTTVVPLAGRGDLEAVLTRDDGPAFERHVVLRSP